MLARSCPTARPIRPSTDPETRELSALEPSVAGGEMANPLDLSCAELEALRELQAGSSARGADDPVWDALEQFGLIESREKAHDRMLTPAGREYLTS